MVKNKWILKKIKSSKNFFTRKKFNLKIATDKSYRFAILKPCIEFYLFWLVQHLNHNKNYKNLDIYDFFV